ncbi:MAG: type II secretion system protein GspD [Zetaproteobacteria bacterium]|nr:MAG: type II secretion system protein GspD [Zetaproteobacteria bacterium]
MMKKWVMMGAMMAMLLSGASQLWAKDVTLNFKNADIRALIEFVAGFSGKNFLVDNRVKGKVTIISPTPIPEDQAYDVFLSVLEINGYATVPSGAVIKIVPRAESKQMPVPLMGKGRKRMDDAMVTQVVRLKYADAQQLAALIRPLIPPNGHLVAYPRGNMLLVTDSANNIARIEKILSIMDRKDAVGVQLFHLHHASADKLAATLNNLYAASGANAPLGKQLRAFAQQPGNMLIVIGAPQTINEVATVIEKLDVAPKADSGRLRVIYLKHAKAEEMAKVLNELVSGQTAASVKGKAGDNKPLFAGDVKIVPDTAINALLVTAGPSDMQAVSRIIERLDIRRRQVLVEALLVEVTGDALERFGVEWLGTTGNFFGAQSFKNLQGLGTALANNAGAAKPVSTPLVLAQAAPAGATVGWVNGALSIGALAHALQSDADANVLSTPNILTMDNEEAEIIVGQNVPFITGASASTGAANPNPFQTIERKDIGLTLRVKPQISGGDTIRLELYQEVSSIDTAATANVTTSDLITRKRSIKTVVLANNGQMIVLGGLMRDDNTASVQKVPCIGAVPLIGEAFKFTENQHRKTNLMVFLRPTIIRSEHDIETITERKYFDIQQLYEKPLKGGTLLFPQHGKKLPDSMKPAKGGGKAR